jgi:hypothetical protein
MRNLLPTLTLAFGLGLYPASQAFAGSNDIDPNMHPHPEIEHPERERPTPEPTPERTPVCHGPFCTSAQVKQHHYASAHQRHHVAHLHHHSHRTG